MKPTSYLYDESDGRFRLYFGGMSTLAGLNLLSPGAGVTEIEYYTDTDSDMPAPVQSATVGVLIEHIEIIPDHVGIYDFSCVIESECKFSSHDDCECHFDVSTAAEARTLVDHLMKPEDSDRLWAILNSNHGCYITFDTTGEFMTYPDFDALLKSQDAR